MFTVFLMIMIIKNRIENMTSVDCIYECTQKCQMKTWLSSLNRKILLETDFGKATCENCQSIMNENVTHITLNSNNKRKVRWLVVKVQGGCSAVLLESRRRSLRTKQKEV